MLMVIFTVLMILVLCGGGCAASSAGNYAPFGVGLLLWICVAILGWVTFGGGLSTMR